MVWPHSLRITPSFLAAISELDEFKGVWRTVGRLAPERLNQLRTVATIQSVGSSTRIEGARLTDADVEKLLSRAFGTVLQTRDEQEVAGYALVMEMILAAPQDIPATEAHIKQLHSLLLRYSEKDVRHRGEYKRLPNRIEAVDASGRSLGVVLDTTLPAGTAREMAELVEWTQKTLHGAELHPLLIIGMFTVVFLAIHPFQDGNGRLSRALTTLLLLRSGYAHIPYASLERLIEQRKPDYYLALRRTQSTLSTQDPDWQPWIGFFLGVLRDHKRELEVTLAREHAVFAPLDSLAARLLELASTHGGLSVAHAVAATQAPRGTVKRRITQLVAAGHLKRIGRGRGTRYLAV